MRRININDIDYYIKGGHISLNLFRKKMSIFLAYGKYEADRIIAAQNRCELDKLVNDPSWEVRLEVAHRGYGLDILINDPAWEVRYTVAEHGYRLDKLIYDSDERVRKMADQKL